MLVHTIVLTLVLALGGLATDPKDAKMAELKLKRLTELNSRLREDLSRERVPVSQAAKSIISHTSSTKDHMVPSVWGPQGKSEDPYKKPLKKSKTMRRRQELSFYDFDVESLVRRAAIVAGDEELMARYAEADPEAFEDDFESFYIE